MGRLDRLKTEVLTELKVSYEETRDLLDEAHELGCFDETTYLELTTDLSNAMAQLISKTLPEHASDWVHLEDRETVAA